MLTKFDIDLTRGQQKRIINILDEDLEMTITRQEYYDAIEAYNIVGEKHFSLDGSPYLAFEIRTLIKLSVIMKERSLTALEVFNSCDISRDGKVDIKELATFIEGISRDFKQKEAFCMMRYLDVDNNGYIDKAEFTRQLEKVDKYYDAYQRSQMLNFYQSGTSNMKNAA